MDTAQDRRRHQSKIRTVKQIVELMKQFDVTVEDIQSYASDSLSPNDYTRIAMKGKVLEQVAESITANVEVKPTRWSVTGGKQKTKDE